MKMHNKLILDPLWLINNPRCYLDEEYQNYKLLSTKQKFENQLSNQNTFNFVELLIHWINTQCLVTDECIYNKKFKEISTENHLLKDIIGELKHDFNNNVSYSSIMTILQQAEYTFSELINKYIEQENKLIDLIEFKSFSNSIHQKDDIFIVYNVNCCDIYEVWRIKFQNNYNLNHLIEKVDNYNYSKSEVPKLITKIKNDYNTDYESILICNTEKSMNSKTIINSIRNILIANKILNINNQFSYKILEQIYNQHLRETEQVAH